MLAVEIRIAGEALKVRRFGGPLNRWELVRPGEEDRLTGWDYEELRRLGEGVFEFSMPEESAVVESGFPAAHEHPVRLLRL
jgi:hypothetical protein